MVQFQTENEEDSGVMNIPIQMSCMQFLRTTKGGTQNHEIPDMDFVRLEMTGESQVTCTLRDLTAKCISLMRDYL